MTAPFNESSILEAALWYASKGFRVIPLWGIHSGKCGCCLRYKRSECENKPGKHPVYELTPHGLTDGTTDPKLIRSWFQAYPGANVGIVCGHDSGLVVVDVDPRHNGDETIARIEVEHGRIDTVEVITGSGGRHFYYHANGNTPHSLNHAADGIDIKAEGGYVVAPPSKHVCGGVYRWDASSEPWEMDPAPMPEWVPALVATVAARPPPKAGEKVPMGARRDWLMRKAAQLACTGITEEAILAAVKAEFETHCDTSTPASPGDLEGIAHSAYAKFAGNAPEPLPAEGWGEDEIAKLKKTLSASDSAPETPLGKTNSAETAFKQNARSVSESMDGAIALFRRRHAGEEKPMPLPFARASKILGGGLWPGAHILTGATAAGKTAFSMQLTLSAARAGYPVLYIGLELDTAQIIARLASLTMGSNAFDGRPAAHWSDIYLGKLDPAIAEPALNQIRSLPIYVEEGPPGGWSVRTMKSRVEQLCLAHPESKLKSPLVVLDFLQLVGPTDPNKAYREELRERIGAASYAGREVARRMSANVLMVSSIARAGATELGKMAKAGELGVIDPSELVGLGKESGDIEFSADTVLSLAGEPRVDGEPDRRVWLAVAKMRAGSPAWDLLKFNGSWLAEVSAEGQAEHVETAQIRKAEQKKANADAARAKKHEALIGKVLAKLGASKAPLSQTKLFASLGGGRSDMSAAVAACEERGLIHQVFNGARPLGYVLSSDTTPQSPTDPSEPIRTHPDTSNRIGSDPSELELYKSSVRSDGSGPEQRRLSREDFEEVMERSRNVSEGSSESKNTRS